MKHILLFLIAFIPFFCLSQDFLTYKKGGRIFNSNNEKVTPEAVRILLINNQQALNLYESGKTKQTVGNILLYGGLATFTAQHLYVINKPQGGINGPNYEKVSNTFYFVGAAMFLISIPIKGGFSKKIKNAVALINEDFKNPKTSFNIESTSFISNTNGLGISITF